MGLHGPSWFPDPINAVICVGSVFAQYYVLRRLGASKRVSLSLSIVVLLLSFGLGIEARGRAPKSPARKWIEDSLGASLLTLNLLSLCTAPLVFLSGRIPAFDGRRRKFLKSTSVAACAIPAAVFTTGIITRKDFHINEVNIGFPDLPADLDGLRLVQISDIHMGTFFTRTDLERVIDATNGLRGDLLFITGDLITDEHDPLDDCLLELGRLRSGNGIWGCMGNHELYAKCQTYTKRQARRLGMDFLRYENRPLRFGNSSLNLMGVDYQKPGMHLPAIDELIQPGSFNLLLSHTPAIFPIAAGKGIDLTLSGHTHGGQINLGIGNVNLNIVDFATPFTKGLYRGGHSAVYVNSGLGTIGVPIRIGAPPEISVIRLCNS